MKPRLAIIGLILGFVAAARADDEPPPAPLENTKQELQTLARDQAANKVGTQEGSMKDALPRMQSPVPSGPALEMPQSSNSPSELKKKKDAQKNGYVRTILGRYLHVLYFWAIVIPNFKIGKKSVEK